MCVRGILILLHTFPYYYTLFTDKKVDRMNQGTINMNQTRVSPNIKTRFKTIDEVIQT